jgi:hypothetical protein
MFSQQNQPMGYQAPSFVLELDNNRRVFNQELFLCFKDFILNKNLEF